MTARLLWLAPLLLLAACAAGPGPVSPQSPAATARGPDAETPAVTAPSAPSRTAGAVDGLLSEAERLRAAGDMQGALLRLERALRIDPQRAEVYLELARSHLEAGNVERAAASADRGLLYCHGHICTELRRLASD
ncbi:MAG: tetratricopeptide (TPR) repeat protein [Halieaceae bacterium]|jgi:tetratricopeptide (TPR) repeat protein